jgi:PAS domain S-box-containing protein
MNSNTKTERRHTLSQSGEEIVYALDLSGTFTFLNHAGELILGYTCEEARRLNIADVVVPEAVEEMRRRIKHRDSEELGSVYEIDIITKDGQRVPLEVSTEFVLRDGQPVEIQGIAMPSVLRRNSAPQATLRCLDADFCFGRAPDCRWLGRLPRYAEM